MTEDKMMGRRSRKCSRRLSLILKPIHRAKAKHSRRSFEGDSISSKALSSLPHDVILCICDYLEVDEAKTCRLVNKELSNALSPFVFKRLKFDNTEKGSKHLLELLSKYGEYVRELCFYMSWPKAYIDYFCWGTDWRDLNRLLPPTVRSILRGGDGEVFTRLRNHTAFTLHLAPKLSGYFDDYLGSPLVKWESNELRDMAVGLIFDLLSQNSRVTKLNLAHVHMHPGLSNIWDSPAFAKGWLEQLDTLHLSIGMWYGASWTSQPLRSKNLFSSFREIIKRAKNLRDLTIDYPRNCVPVERLGDNGGHAFSTFPGHLDGNTPLNKLRRLELVQCCVSLELCEFIQKQALELETIILHDCYALVSRSGPQVYWSDLFISALEGPAFRKLVRFDVHCSPIFLPYGNNGYYFRSPYRLADTSALRKEGDAVQDCFARQEQIPDAPRVNFCYASLEGDDGLLCPDTAMQLMRFLTNADQHMFDALMFLLPGNSIAASKKMMRESNEHRSTVATHSCADNAGVSPVPALRRWSSLLHLLQTSAPLVPDDPFQ